MFELTQKAERKNLFIIHHVPSGDYDYSEFTLTEAVDCITKDILSLSSMGEFTPEADKARAKEEAYRSLCIYSKKEVLEEAGKGYGWPINLGYVREIED